MTDITTFWKSTSDRLPGFSRLSQMYTLFQLQLNALVQSVRFKVKNMTVDSIMLAEFTFSYVS